jgi:SagB-type dehydrogenase family enzyme
LKLRSARCQSAYWRDGELRIVNFLTRGEFSANPIVLEILSFFYFPRTLRDALLKFDAYTPYSVGAAIRSLVKAELLLRCGSAEAERDEHLDSSWSDWLPAGGFHFLSKDAPYAKGSLSIEEKMQPAPLGPQPVKFKTLGKTARIALPAASAPPDAFFETLHARRTHHQFSAAPVPLASLAQLLRATWGVQGYVNTDYFGPLPLKTSPSGGARHPVEVYMLALRVDGLRRGLYHYHARDHVLEVISSGATARQARAYCVGQGYAARAAALFIMTAVFARTMWKYRHARAYRVVLLDAGHLAQTFCLTATRLRLAPFTTAALKDSLLERDLGIDGISESVLYVCGVGTPAARPGSTKAVDRGRRCRRING